VLIPAGELLRCIQGQPSLINLSAHPSGPQLRAAWEPAYAELLNSGRFLPDDYVIRLVDLYKAGFPSSSKFLYDGFPRNLSQVIALDLSLRQSGHNPKDLQFITLEAPDEKLKERNHLRFMTGQRADDDPATFADRLRTYRQSAVDICHYYRKSGREIEIDAGGTIQETVVKLRKELGRSYAVSLPLLPPISESYSPGDRQRARAVNP
jgi:adenylate kinase